MKGERFLLRDEKLIVRPCREVSGEVEPPPDKSISHRAAIISAVFKGRSFIENFLFSRDTLATLDCLKKVGVKVEVLEGKDVVLESPGLQDFSETHEILDAQNSATTMRLFTGVLCATGNFYVFTGDRYLVKRPMKRIIEPLSLMGATILSRSGGYPPLGIKGSKLNGIEYCLKIPSAQVKSSIILAGLFARGKTAVFEQTKSRDHTENMLRWLGIPLKVSEGLIEVEGTGVLEGNLQFEVPGDPSSAAFFAVAGALSKSGEVRIRNVNLNPTRTGFLNVLKRAGAEVSVKVLGEKCGEPFGDISVKPSRRLKGFEIREEEVPSLIDEVPILAVLAAFCDGISRFEGLSELRVKETDRLSAVACNLEKMGAKVKVDGDALEVEGTGMLKGSELESYGDHRIAMAFTVAALFSKGESTIKDPACMDVSYPDFLDDMSRLLICAP